MAEPLPVVAGGEIRLWDAEHAQEILRLAGHEWPVFKVQFGSKSASLSSGSARQHQ